MMNFFLFLFFYNLTSLSSFLIFARDKDTNPIKLVESSAEAVADIKIDMSEDDAIYQNKSNKNNIKKYQKFRSLNQTNLSLRRKNAKNKKLTPSEVEALMLQEQERNNFQDKLHELEDEKQRLELKKLEKEIELLDYVKSNQEEDTRLKRLEIKEKEKIKFGFF